MASTTELAATTDLPSGDPVPAAAAPPPQPKPFPLKSLIAAAPSNADAFLAHVQRCLQTPSGIDTVLLFLCYTSRFSAAALETLVRPAIERSAKQLLALASALPPSATIFFSSKALPSSTATLVLLLAKRLKAFSLLLSDVRTFMRLWGLLGMYFWGRGLLLKARQPSAKSDRVETTISWCQLTACVIFQSLENGAYLASKGVLGWAPASQIRAARWSARFWSTFVGLELGRLLYESHKRGQRTRRERIGDKTVAQVEKEESEWADTWRKSVARNSAWFPLTIHWSSEQPLVSELAIGTLASIPGIIQMRDLWRRTAQ
jgi:hypothetical protein